MIWLQITLLIQSSVIYVVLLFWLEVKGLIVWTDFEVAFLETNNLPASSTQVTADRRCGSLPQPPSSTPLATLGFVSLS